MKIKYKIKPEIAREYFQPDEDVPLFILPINDTNKFFIEFFTEADLAEFYMIMSDIALDKGKEGRQKFKPKKSAEHTEDIIFYYKNLSYYRKALLEDKEREGGESDITDGRGLLGIEEVIAAQNILSRVIAANQNRRLDSAVAETESETESLDSDIAETESVLTVDTIESRSADRFQI
ncbi:Oidioi.mRNA.OKI2018_I69.PAR.g9626.t1.cds [Oikopleura dioica]|uniref:Oidioi.mRNA.OKI2018_I69.PAR.g9626.t1.cds n=1 Tax=Oikopleura dioica TaxID=34765 RepID=A0ABN7RLG6_OIKDI|nr:Oidioi.mRNA.OKI2018_I69.PAR.g9626.t1.cds [Oikopleura dioica]